MKKDHVIENLMKELLAHFSKLREIMLNDLLQLGDDLMNIPSTRIQWFVQNFARDCFLEVDDEDRRRQLLEFASTKTDQEIFLTLHAVGVLTKANLPLTNVPVLRHPDERHNNNLCELVFKSDQEDEHVDKKARAPHSSLMEYKFTEVETYTSWAILMLMVNLVGAQDSLLKVFYVYDTIFARQSQELSLSDEFVFDHFRYMLNNSPYRFLFNPNNNSIIGLSNTDLNQLIVCPIQNALRGIIDIVKSIIQTAPVEDDIDQIPILKVLNNFLNRMEIVIAILNNIIDTTKNIDARLNDDNEELLGDRVRSLSL